MSLVKSNALSQRLLVFGVILNLTICISLLFLYVWKGNDSNKVVYVDAVKLMKGYKGMDDAKKELTVKASVWQANLDTLRKEAETAIKDYESTKAKATTRERELMETLIESKQQQYSSYEQSIKTQFQKQDQELSQGVLEKINDFIKRYGKKKGYTFIMAATQYGNIVYAEGHVDITDEVLEGLNAEYSSR